MEFLFFPVPVWLLLAVTAAAAVYVAWRCNRLERRLNGHAESIANMDVWADDVETHLEQFRRAERQRSARYVIDRQVAPGPYAVSDWRHQEKPRRTSYM